MRKPSIPNLSSLNGPSYVLHAVEVLYALGVPESNVRILPVIDHFARPEVLPYQERLTREGVSPDDVDPATLLIRLGINVRDDNRFASLLPLVAVGMPPADVAAGTSPELADEESADLSLAERVCRWSRQRYEQLQEQIPDWTNEPPVARFVDQLRERYAEFRERGSPDEAATGYIRAGAFESDYREERRAAVAPVVQRRRDAAGLPGTDPQRGIAEELAELFFTRAFLAIACGDMLGGFEFDHRIQPEGRQIAVTVNDESGIETVVEWLGGYPHLVEPEPPIEVLNESERRAWEQHFQNNPERRGLFVTDVDRWTADDPGVAKIHQEIRKQYQAGRSEDMTADEMLTLARKHLPDYEPHYPQQRSVTGGLNLGGILLRLIHRWLEHGRFLGITQDDFQRFDPAQQVVLCALLLQRRQVYDYAALFLAAARLLIHREITLETEQLVPHPGSLGTPFSQPSKTMALGGAAVLHAPEAVVRIPFDRTRSEEAEEMEAKLDILRRLLMPVHIPVRYQWGVNWIDLDPPIFPLDPTSVTRDLWDDMSGYLKCRAAWMPPEDHLEESPS